jgi:hypothetical protein
VPELHAIPASAFPPKSDWGPGPWQDEPDRDEWIDRKTGLACRARRAAAGHWCAYVGVLPSHPLYERDVREQREDVTWAELCIPGSPVEARWWFGIHARVSGIPSPGRASLEHHRPSSEETARYVPLADMRARCAELAAWLSA